MKEKGDNWNIYYCGDDEFSLPKQETSGAQSNSEEKIPAEDIPVSKYHRYDTISGDKDYSEECSDREYYSDPGKRKRKMHRVILGVFLAIVIVFLVAVYLVIDGKLDLINYDDGINFDNADQTVFYDEDEEPAFTPVHDVTDAYSLKDWLKKWATNDGEKMYGKNVVNCLLCGVDTQEGSAGRTDAMILVSVNKKTDKITLVSFMRDSYTYMDINGKDRWYKINSAYNWGGPMTLVETIENNYKIEIDNYIMVDFDTFPKLVNALGGITVEVQPYEANYINRTTVHTIESGKEVTLDGWEALVFARIRYSDADGDISRTRRQRQIVTSFIKKAKSASIGQLNNLTNLVLPFVRTNMRKTEILSLGTQAIMQDWMDFEMVQIASPLMTSSEDGKQKLTGKDSYMTTGYGSKPEFVWIVDYQLDAYRVQNALYGTSNIEIHDTRETPFNFLSGGTQTETTTESSAEPVSGEDEPSTDIVGGILDWMAEYNTTSEYSEEDLSTTENSDHTLPYSSDFEQKTESQYIVDLF